VGSSKLFLNTDHTKYSWIDTEWLKSLWEFTNLVNLQFALPSNWLPSTPREHDIFFMEYLQTLRLSSKQMDLLNQCDMYLQVIMLVDIVSADGTYILPEAKQGNQLTGRKSRLTSPRQSRPDAATWKLWQLQLMHLERYERLVEPLGSWVAHHYQQWEVFWDPSDESIYQEEGPMTV
jgi:hypothetical protein